MTNKDFREQRMLELMTQLPQNKGEEWDTVVPVVDFAFSPHPDPVKARRQNIKRAMKALKPTKRWFAIPGFALIPFLGRHRYKHTDSPHRCVVDGADCRQLDYGELFDQYFRDPNTMQVETFHPTTGVIPGRGRKLGGTYCPQHMQLYHLMNEWIEQESHDSDTGFFKQMKKKGVSFVPVKRNTPKDQHPLIVKWTPAFIEAQKDGIPIMHYKNPVTGENDLTMIVFDNRVLESTMPQTTQLGSQMSVAQYHKLVEMAAAEETQ